MSDFEGKSVIVTGASSGIGEATAILFASKGCNVTLCGRDSGRLQDAAEKCKEAGATGGHTNRFITVAGDLTDSSVRKKVVEEAILTFSRVDVLVANHGVFNGKTPIAFADLSEEVYDTSFDTNIKSVVFMIQEAVPYLEKTKGSIVCVSSIYSTLAGQVHLPYSMGKAALDHMVRCLALELGPKGIRVNAVNPTFVSTRLGRDTVPGLSGMNPMKHLFDAMTPLPVQGNCATDQAHAIAFLVSEDARFITGQCLAVDGGLICKGSPLNWLPVSVGQ